MPNPLDWTWRGYRTPRSITAKSGPPWERSRYRPGGSVSGPTLQDAAKGRVILGIGRGDSSLAHLGSGPMKLAPFGDYLDRVQAYLGGDAVPFDPADTENPRQATLASLEYAHTPLASRIEWLPSDQLKVPVDIATSGPKVTALAAAKADGVTFGLGVDPEILTTAIERVRDGCRAAGRDPSEVSVSALVSVAVHPDRDVARSMAAGSAASISRWQLMQGAGRSSMSEADYVALDRTRKAYDMTRHGATNSSHSAAMPADLLERFAIAGPPDHCIARLKALTDLGLSRIVIPYRQMGTDPETQALATRLLLEEVIPALKG